MMQAAAHIKQQAGIGTPRSAAETIQRKMRACHHPVATSARIPDSTTTRAWVFCALDPR
jgi:hypothetical protein